MIKHGGPSLLSRWPKVVSSSGPTLADVEAAFATAIAHDAVIAAWAVHDTSTASMSSSRTTTVAVTVPDGPVGQMFDQKGSYNLSASNNNSKRPFLTNGLTFDDIDDTLGYQSPLPSLTMTAMAIHKGTKAASSRAMINGGVAPYLEWMASDGAAAIQGGGSGAAYADGTSYATRGDLSAAVADGEPHRIEWRGMVGSEINSRFSFSQESSAGVAGIYIPICFMDEAQADLAAARTAAAAYCDILITYLGL